MARLRKLISYNTLTAMHERYQLGVPVTKIIEHYHPECSVPVLTSLLQFYTEYEQQTRVDNSKGAKIIADSLFPPWLDTRVSSVQEEAKGWYYTGRFPLGVWSHNEDN